MKISMKRLTEEQRQAYIDTIAAIMPRLEVLVVDKIKDDVTTELAEIIFTISKILNLDDALRGQLKPGKLTPVAA